MTYVYIRLESYLKLILFSNSKKISRSSFSANYVNSRIMFIDVILMVFETLILTFLNHTLFKLFFFFSQRNWYLMIPWVVLGGMLAVGLLVSILINSIKFYIDGDNLNGTLWLVLGLLSLGKLYESLCFF